MEQGIEREKLGSRLGFLLLSAGCAIGLGNVWRFPFITAAYGGRLSSSSISFFSSFSAFPLW